MPSQMGLSLLETITGIDHISQTASFLRVKNKRNNKESRKQQHKYKGNTYSSIFPVQYCWMKVNGKAPTESARGGPHGGLRESGFPKLSQIMTSA